MQFYICRLQKIIKKKLSFLHDISILPKRHMIGVSVALASGKGSFLSLIKLSNSLVNGSVIRHMLNAVSVSDSVATDAETTFQTAV